MSDIKEKRRQQSLNYMFAYLLGFIAGVVTAIIIQLLTK